MKQLILNLIFACILTLSYGQYVGGPSDGFGFSEQSSNNLSEPIYRGGNGDGFEAKLIGGQLIGASIYIGGIGSGITRDTLFFQTIGKSIYLGGIGQGYYFDSIDSQYIGFSTYLGGIGKGNTEILESQQTIGLSIYHGGIADGFGSTITSQNAMGLSIYHGGQGDGSIQVAIPLRIIGENFYKGGAGKGERMIQGINLTLPVQILEFKAIWPEENVIVFWSSSQEINNSHYTLYRSLNGNDYSKTYEVKGKGNSQNIQQYSFVDSLINEYPEISTWYYRLVQTDNNGQEAIIAEKAVSKDKEFGQEIMAFPNPTMGELFLTELSSQGTEYKVGIQNELGVSLWNGSLTLPNKIDFSHYKSGLYLLCLTDMNGHKKHFKIIKY
jgi:hypothetical protein